MHGVFDVFDWLLQRMDVVVLSPVKKPIFIYVGIEQDHITAFNMMSFCNEVFAVYYRSRVLMKRYI